MSDLVRSGRPPLSMSMTALIGAVPAGRPCPRPIYGKGGPVQPDMHPRLRINVFTLPCLIASPS
jgi:hypothetical protein